MNNYENLFNEQAFLLETLIEDCNNCGYAIKTIHMEFQVATVMDEKGKCMSLKFNHIDTTWDIK